MTRNPAKGSRFAPGVLSSRGFSPRFLFLAVLVCACSRAPDTAVIRDDLGREVSLAKTERLITLAPNLTEIVYAIGSGTAIVATDDFSDMPPPARGLPKVGGLQPNVEKIAALQPDLVIATTNGNHPNLAPALAAVKIPLFVVRTDRLDEIPATMTRLGEILGSSNAAAAAEALRTRVAGQRRSRQRPSRVMFLVWGDPLYVAGRATFSDDLLSLTGAQNAVLVNGWPQYSLESLASSPPDIILYPDRSVARAQIDKLLKVISPSRAVMVEAVNENLFTRPGPRMAEAAAALNAILDRWEREVR